MTTAAVHRFVQHQVVASLDLVNHHGISLGDALVPPQRISIIERDFVDGKPSDGVLDVWLVAREPSPEGYRIVMRESDGLFGLASPGFQKDQPLFLVGWYGDLPSTFANM